MKSTQQEINELKRLRHRFGLTQTKAAESIGVTLRSWQYYEAGKRKMSPGYFELFILKHRNKLIDDFTTKNTH